MKLYLSSFHLGNHPEKLVSLFGSKPYVAIISNAKDYIPAPEKQERLNEQIKSLKSFGVESGEVDLRNFKNTEALKTELKKYNGVWIVGGNAFLLRRAMFDSGFNLVIKELLEDPARILLQL